VNIVRAAGDKPCEIQAIENPKIPVETYVAAVEQQQEAQAAKKPLFERMKGRVGEWGKRWFGW
jgi:hypothetical protein